MLMTALLSVRHDLSSVPMPCHTQSLSSLSMYSFATCSHGTLNHVMSFHGMLNMRLQRASVASRARSSPMSTCGGVSGRSSTPSTIASTTTRSASTCRSPRAPTSRARASRPAPRRSSSWCADPGILQAHKQCLGAIIPVSTGAAAVQDHVHHQHAIADPQQSDGGLT